MSDVEVRYVEHPQANLSYLVDAVQTMQTQVNSLSSEVTTVDRQVETIQSQFEDFMNEFRRFVVQNVKDRRLQEALSDRVSLQQELEQRFSRHQTVRKHVTGILQASDVKLVRKETVADCTEELMISVPHYWLAPALIALSAWLNDNRDLAEKALREAMNRDDEKTSLLFCLICRRAQRNTAASEWLQRYFAMQDPMNIERKMIIVLDAYANGLFGGDSRGMCARQLATWIAEMEDTVGFREAQVARWENAILGKIPGEAHGGDYPYLSRYATNWQRINDMLNNAMLHGQMLSYLHGVFEQPATGVAELKEQLDALLNSLVTNYDSQELPLRERKRFADLIVQCKGDEAEASRLFDAEKSSFDERSDLTQLLTNAAMNPELVHASAATQKLSMSISRDWMIEAYDNVTLRNRSQAINEVEFEIEGFKASTAQGDDEEQLCARAKTHFDAIRDGRLANIKQSPMDFFLVGAGVVALVLGFAGVLPWIAGVVGCALGALKFVLGKKKVKQDIEDTYKSFEKLNEDVAGIIRAICAETVDLRRETAQLENGYIPLMDYMKGIAPEQYVMNNGQRSIGIA